MVLNNETGDVGVMVRLHPTEGHIRAGRLFAAYKPTGCSLTLIFCVQKNWLQSDTNLLHTKELAAVWH